jgi:hypothetical protein
MAKCTITRSLTGNKLRRVWRVDLVMGEGAGRRRRKADLHVINGLEEEAWELSHIADAHPLSHGANLEIASCY